MPHTDEHPHTHEDDHPEVMSATSGAEQTKALLAYMIHHNEHHAEELADLLDRLEDEPRKKLSSAIDTFEAANVELRGVLDCLE